MTDLNIRRNPAPQQRYEVTLEIKDAPGPFEVVEGFMQYEVRDDQCVPKDPVSGAHPQRPKQTIPAQYERVTENTYRATIYTDLLLDDDYFGLGLCPWKLVATRAALRAKAAYETRFVTDLSLDELKRQQRKFLYFPKSEYSTPNLGYPAFGIGPEMLRPEHSSAKFTITMTARWETP